MFMYVEIGVWLWCLCNFGNCYEGFILVWCGFVCLKNLVVVSLM